MALSFNKTSLKPTKNFLKQKSIGKKRLFSNVFRFIDGPCAFNNDEFENDYNDNYHDELELKKENEDSFKASFFNLSIEVHIRIFLTYYF